MFRAFFFSCSRWNHPLLYEIGVSHHRVRLGIVARMLGFCLSRSWRPCLEDTTHPMRDEASSSSKFSPGAIHFQRGLKLISITSTPATTRTHNTASYLLVQRGLASIAVAQKLAQVWFIELPFLYDSKATREDAGAMEGIHMRARSEHPINGTSSE